MVRRVVTDRWGLAAAAALLSIYRCEHPACNAGDLRALLCYKGRMTSRQKRNGQAIKTLRRRAKLLLRLPFLENGRLWAEASCQALGVFSLSPSQVHNKPWWSEDIKVRSCVETVFCLKKMEVFDPSPVIRAWKRCCDLKHEQPLLFPCLPNPIHKIPFPLPFQFSHTDLPKHTRPL